jgi:hypothetical protein
MSEDLTRLSELFAMLGAKEPESWASSQLLEGIPQLERYLFLRQAWRAVVTEADTTWVDNTIHGYRENPTAPYARLGRALESLRLKGATAEEISDIVRGKQAELLFGLCCLLEDPGDLEDEVADVSWGLFRVDENGSPVEHIGGLYESVLETDPTA